MIYDKEGNVYKLKGTDVKPIDNSKWDDIILHNFEWGAVTLPDKKPNSLKFKSDFEVKEKEVEIPIIKESPTVEQPFTEEIKEPEPTKEPVIEYVERDKNDFLQEHKVVMWCLPVTRKQKTDTLYGENYYTVEFGTKFKFEAIIISQHDLTLHFWTKNVHVDKNYVISVIGTREDRDARCWQVYKTESRSGGLLVESIPSDYSPDFTS